MADKPRYWHGETTCNLCKIKKPTELFDARMINGHWALLCRPCFKANTMGRLGPGSGQHYVRTDAGLYVKVIR